MAVRKRGKRWFVDVSGKGRRLTATCPTKIAAHAREAELRLDLDKGPGVHCWTLAQAWQRTYDVAWSGMPNDMRMVRMRRLLVGYWGADTRLDRITTDLVDAWARDMLRQGNTGATVNRKLAALSKITRIAAERPERSGYVPANRPVFHYQKEPEGRIREVTEAEEAEIIQLLNQWGQPEAKDVILTLMDTGLRCGELWRLEQRDVDLARGLISVWQSKTGRARHVPMTKRVRAIIERRYHAGRLFPYSNDWLRTPWNRLRFMMCLDQDKLFVPHILRHTCACRLMQRGAGIEVVRDWLGHKSFAMTMRYARLAPANLIDLIDAAKLLDPCGVSPRGNPGFA